MTYTYDKKKGKLPQSKILSNGFGITREDNKRAIANDNVIDCNKRSVGNGKINKNEPKFTK